MTRSIRGSRRAALLLSGMAATTGLLLSGCGAGQVAETANKEPSVQGVNVSAGNGEYAVRGLLIEFPGVEGYQAGANATLNAVIYNDSESPVTVTVTTDSAREVVITGGTPSAIPSASPSQSPSDSPSETAAASASATPSEPASESPSASGSASPSAPPSVIETPAAPAGQPARIEIPPLSYVQLNTEAQQTLQLIGLDESLRSGQNVFVTFDFGNGASVTGAAPVAVPLTPAAPPSPIIEREGGYEGGGEDGEHGGEGGSDH
ncbi:hypothetical protein [Micromonospora endolithica]|uniref:Copper chaperone PCu(A)C n=1 Tax=Micromonospora endolithica TaxID=230091 RepID=A0A3A9YUC4_9ACTN|nr:hypothetical protein [Micromonospora endolithica]RKN38846.1 hypothetical protein D7223_29865 [Micromonospora endolithica]TWJ25470.1 hypothetical protein JD76_05641 [Micromonospora endolithica]